jgi:circadian clock protein KaiB
MDDEKPHEPGSNDGPADAETFEASVPASPRKERYVLRLYIAGNSPRSRGAIRCVRTICDKHIPGEVDLEVYDLHQQPWMARQAEVVAAPTLVKELPPPLKRIIGSLTDIDDVLAKLGIGPRSPGGSTP